jgi:hypothetical protein
LGLAISSRAYSFGGIDSGAAELADVDYYDPVGDSWTGVNDMGATRSQPGGAVL